MKGWRRPLALALLAGAAALLLAACGGSGVAYPSINFVGNASCPTASASPYDPKPPAVNGDKIVGTAIAEMPHIHVGAGTKVDYNHDPPTSGCHYSQGSPDPAPIAPGSYDKEIAAEYWVHNLEHGYIVVLYNCPTGCTTEFDQLHAWQKSLPPDPAGNGQIPYAKVVVLPWHTMKDHFAVVSWDYYLGMSALDMTQVKAFFDNHVGHSPEGSLTG